MLEVLLLVAVIILIIGSLTDLKTREVPDWVNFSGIFLGIGLRLFFSVYEFDWSFLIEGLMGLALAYVLAQLMYRLGQWGGGDSKMIMALGALLGIQFRVDHITVSFIMNLLVVGALYGVAWSVYLGALHRKSVMKKIKKIWSKTTHHRIGAYTMFVLFILIALFIDSPMRWVIIVLAFSAVLLVFLGIFMKGVEDVSFLKKVSVNKLTEGDWIAKVVKFKNKIICSPKDLGISKEQIKKLKKLKIPSVWIKEGIPFIPSFLLAYLASIFIGNIIIEILKLFV